MRRRVSKINNTTHLCETKAGQGSVPTRTRLRRPFTRCPIVSSQSNLRIEQPIPQPFLPPGASDGPVITTLPPPLCLAGHPVKQTSHNRRNVLELCKRVCQGSADNPSRSAPERRSLVPQCRMRHSPYKAARRRRAEPSPIVPRTLRTGAGKHVLLDHAR
jgi:hypothetical protein